MSRYCYCRRCRCRQKKNCSNRHDIREVNQVEVEIWIVCLLFLRISRSKIHSEIECEQGTMVFVFKSSLHRKMMLRKIMDFWLFATVDEMHINLSQILTGQKEYVYILCSANRMNVLVYLCALIRLKWREKTAQQSKPHCQWKYAESPNTNKQMNKRISNDIESCEPECKH